MASNKRPQFQYPKGVENQYAAQLRKLAKYVQDLVSAHENDDGLIEEDEYDSLTLSAGAYAKAIEPFASKIATQMIQQVSSRNYYDWMRASEALGVGLKRYISQMDLQHVYQERRLAQIALIKSLPTESAARAKDLSTQAYLGGRRPEEAARMISATGEVTRSRANVIARTETAKTNHDVTKYRSKGLGANQYKWQTAQDEVVRPAHRAMQGLIFDWDDPPTVGEEGEHGPGDYPNCRCFGEPILDDLL